MAASKRELLKCKTKDEVLAYAKKESLPTRKNGNEVTVGGWVCVFNGNKFQYIK